MEALFCLRKDCSISKYLFKELITNIFEKEIKLRSNQNCSVLHQKGSDKSCPPLYPSYFLFPSKHSIISIFYLSIFKFNLSIFAMILIGFFRAWLSCLSRSGSFEASINSSFNRSIIKFSIFACLSLLSFLISYFAAEKIQTRYLYFCLIFASSSSITDHIYFSTLVFLLRSFS